MENASKALIIAGSILVSIVIITLGVMIVNNVRNKITDNSNLSATEVNAFNSQFDTYEGKQSGTNARALYNVVRNHNNQNTDDPTLQILLTIDGGEYTGSDVYVAATDTVKDMPANTLKAGNTYNVTFATDKSSGRITAINIKKVN